MPPHFSYLAYQRFCLLTVFPTFLFVLHLQYGAVFTESSAEELLLLAFQILSIHLFLHIIELDLAEGNINAATTVIFSEYPLNLSHF